MPSEPPQNANIAYNALIPGMAAILVRYDMIWPLPGVTAEFAKLAFAWKRRAFIGREATTAGDKEMVASMSSKPMWNLEDSGSMNYWLP